MISLELAYRSFGMLDQIPVGACVLQRNYVVLFWNEKLEEWSGISRGRIVGTNICDLFPRLQSPVYANRIQSVIDGGTPTVFSSQLHQHVLPMNLPNGQKRIQQTTVTPVRAGANDDNCALMVIQDVTDLTTRMQEYRRLRDQALDEVEVRKKIEGKLAQANEDLAHHRKEMEDFLHIVTHDLKRPVVSMHALLGVLAQEVTNSGSEQSNEMLTLSLSECDRMTDMLKQLSHVSQIDRADVEMIDTQLKSFLGSCVRGFQQRIDEQGVNVVLECEDTELSFARAQVQEAVDNLIENALNYGCSSAEPRIAIRTELSDDLLKIMVADNGQGIEAQFHDAVFEIFRRLKPDETQGSGVGLAAVQRLMERIGGQVSLASSDNDGATFTLEFPVKLHVENT